MSILKESHKYDDIINLPHHKSIHYPHMSNYERSAQFSPFAALTGHDEAIKETARLTYDRITLSDEAYNDINEKLCYICNNKTNDLIIEIVYFVRDDKKVGGHYLVVEGYIKKVSEVEGFIIMNDNRKINFENIISLEIK